MPTPQADRQRSKLLAIAFLAFALAALSLRMIKSARELGGRPIPLTDLQSLSSFLVPLPEASVLARGANGTMVVIRDPFTPTGFARVEVPAGTTVEAPRPTTEVGQHWVVSSILLEGSKRSAIVNNAWVTVGDPLGGGSRLTAVERTHIVVTDAKGVRHVVPIQGGES